MKKVVIFAPFWGQAGHVGNNRVDRFVRWLAADGFRVIMIRAGSTDSQRKDEWGMTITVRDPLGLYRDASPTGEAPVPRKPNKLRRSLSYWLFNPDAGVVWARRAARHPQVREAATGAAFILSSSPPESAHVGAWLIARDLQLRHVVDLRDGWLDEPLKPMLHTSAFRRWLEGRLELKILRNANAILVTSAVWCEMLSLRLPELTAKVTVLTNGYPQHLQQTAQINTIRMEDGITLVHAGRFLGSRLTQSPDLILQPLLAGLCRRSKKPGVVRLLGALGAEELALIERFRAPFAKQGWSIDCPGNLARDALLQLLPRADGLLLLSASHAAIPSKLFEYIPTSRPILVVTERDGAVWRIAEKLPQAFCVALSEADKSSNLIDEFLNAAVETNMIASCPNEYSEANLSADFKRVLDGHPSP